MSGTEENTSQSSFRAQLSVDTNAPSRDSPATVNPAAGDMDHHANYSLEAPMEPGVRDSGEADDEAWELQWLIVEEMGHRDFSIAPRQTLRHLCQFVGVKGTRMREAVFDFLQRVWPQDAATSPGGLGEFAMSGGEQHEEYSSGGEGVSLRRRLALARNRNSGLGEISGAATTDAADAARLYAARTDTTVREQWGRRTLRPIRDPAEADPAHEVVVLRISRSAFISALHATLDSIVRRDYSTADLRRRLSISFDVVRRKHPLVIFCGGTSGCGKSTLAHLIAARLGIRTVLSTDNIRELLRKHRTELDFPELFASTYTAHERVSPADPAYTRLSPEDRVWRAYEVQSRMVLEVLDRILTGFVARSEPVVVEGVHLLRTYLVAKAQELAYSEIPCIPVFIKITNAAKHRERFAIRSKSMTLLPNSNKYVKHFSNIRLIQERLLSMGAPGAAQPGADAEAGPAPSAASDDFLVINNTNVDRSLNMIHAYVLEYLETFSSLPSMARNWRPSTRSRAISGKEALKNIQIRRAEKRFTTVQRSISAEADARVAQRWNNVPSPRSRAAGRAAPNAVFRDPMGNNTATDGEGSADEVGSLVGS